MELFCRYLLCSLSIFLGRGAFAVDREVHIRIGTYSSDPPGIETLAPIVNQDVGLARILTADPLVFIDPEGQVTPALATSWSRESPNLWRFKLREGVVFHNDEPFNASVTQYSIEKMLDPATGTLSRQVLSSIKEVRTDPRRPNEVLIETKYPDAMFIRRLNFVSMVPPKYLAQVGLRTFHEHPVGTGPFMFVKWKHGQEIILKRNPKYWNQGIPRIDLLSLIIAPHKELTERLFKGDLDILPNLDGRYTLRVAESKSFTIRKRLVLKSTLCLLRNQGPLGDVRVRRALNYALDKDEMVKYIDHGNAVPMTSYAPVGGFGKDPKLPGYPFDLKKAKALLRTTAFPRGLTLRALVADSSETLARVVQNQLKRLTVDLKLSVVPHQDLFGRIAGLKTPSLPGPGKTSSEVFDIVFYPYGNTMVDFLNLASNFYSKAEAHLRLYEDQEFDRLYEQALSAMEPAEYEMRLQALDRWIHDESLALFTTQKIMTLVARKGLELAIPLSGTFNTDDTLAQIQVLPENSNKFPLRDPYLKRTESLPRP